jgi:tetratricopeptide (TPR) repeat protein
MVWLIPAWSLLAEPIPSDLSQQGIWALEHGQFEQALTIFDQMIQERAALTSDAPSAAVYANRCLVNLHLGRYPSAIADCTQAIEFQGTLTEPYLNRGLAYYRQGQFESALADYNAFLQRQPQDYRGFYNRGLVRLAQKALTEAQADFDHALTLASQEIGADEEGSTSSSADVLATIYDDRGLSLLLAQEPDAAIASFTQAIALDPTNIRAYFNRGCACHQLGRTQEALADFAQVLALNPSHSRTYLERGLIRQAQGDRTGAIADLRTAATYAQQQGFSGLHHYILTLLDSLQTPVVSIG